MLSAANLKGTRATLLLPLNKDDSIDFGCLQEELDIICGSGIDGVYTNGTAGEFYNQSEAEFDRIQLLVSEKCRKVNIPFQVGASHSSPGICLDRIERTLALKPDAYQVIFPDWLPLTDEEQCSFLKKIAQEAEGIPLILYHPGHAKAVLRPEDFSRLHNEVPELIGIKVAAKGEEWFEQMRIHGKGLGVFIQGHRLATGIKEGVATGSYSNMACFNPFGAAAWYRLMLENIEEALWIEKEITVFFENCILPYARAGYADPALDKLLAFAGGWTMLSTRLRWPYKWISEMEALRIRDQAKKMLPTILTKI